jgi:hypothetical protein
MLHQTRHDFLETLILRVCEAFDDSLRDRVLIEIAHLRIP